jgi:hypothetical protein
MTDRELLEAAAKAAGYAECDFLSFEFDGLMNVYFEDGTQHSWNPLEDDGDALRLAVKLGLMVSYFPLNEVHVQCGDVVAMEPCGNDPYAATRRAIVRAAASISTKEK